MAFGKTPLFHLENKLFGANGFIRLGANGSVEKYNTMLVALGYK